MKKHICFITDKICAGRFDGELGSMPAENASDKDTAFSVVKVCLWYLVVLVENYVFVNETVMLRASGRKKTALENLIRVYSKDIGARLKRFMEEHPEELA